MLRHAIGAARKPGRCTVLALTLTGVLALTTVSGCGQPSGSTNPSATDSGSGAVEKTKITVAIMETVSLAPFHLADKEGYFKQEGLEVAFTVHPSGQATLQKLLAGEADIAYGSYVAFFVGQGKGMGDIKFVADANSASPRSNMIVTKPGSSVRTVSDLAGKRIGVTAINTAADAMTKAVMKSHGVDYSTVTWVPVSLPETASALANGTIDAANLSEPSITQAARSVGAMPVVDVAAGPAEDLPMGGFAALGKFVAGNPKTVAAFQRAMKKATDEANADRRTLEPVIVQYAKVDRDTAALITLPNYQSTLDPRRLQRVPDQLLEFDIIPRRIDANAMIAPQWGK